MGIHQEDPVAPRKGGEGGTQHLLSDDILIPSDIYHKGRPEEGPEPSGFPGVDLELGAEETLHDDTLQSVSDFHQVKIVPTADAASTPEHPREISELHRRNGMGKVFESEGGLFFE